MIRKGIKNYFTNLRHFFSSLGAFALGVVLGVSVLIPGIVAAVQTLSETIADVTGSADLDFHALLESVVDAAGKLNWQDPSEALRTALSEEWLSETFNTCIHALLPGMDAYAEQIAAAVAVAVVMIFLCLAACVFLSFLGLAGSFLHTRFLVRRTIARKAWWKNFLSALFDSAFTALMAALLLWIRSLWEPGALLAGIAFILLCSVTALLKAYLLHGRGKLPLREVVNAKNAGLLLLTNILVLFIAGAFVWLSYALTNEFAGTFLAVPFLFIGLSVVLYNAESYVIARTQPPRTALPQPLPAAA